MSLDRLALRQATIMALGDGNPTMAAHRIYDSRIDAVDDGSFSREPLPIAIVYTDGDQMRSVAGQSPHPQFQRTATLVVELWLSTFERTDQGFKMVTPSDDAELAAWLDVFEHQVVSALFDPLSRWAVLWQKIVREVSEIKSEVYIESKDSKTRMAARQMTFDVTLDGSCLPVSQINLEGNGTASSLLGRNLQAVIDLAQEDQNGSAEAARLVELGKVLTEIDLPSGKTLPPLKILHMMETAQPEAQAVVAVNQNT